MTRSIGLAILKNFFTRREGVASSNILWNLLKYQLNNLLILTPNKINYFSVLKIIIIIIMIILIIINVETMEYI